MQREKSIIDRCEALISSFREYSWSEITELAQSGKIGPHNDMEFALLVSDKKPMALATPRMGSDFKFHFGDDKYRYYPISELDDRSDDFYKGGICSLENSCRIEQASYGYSLCDDNGSVGPHSVSMDLILGDALGYTKSDLAKWVARNIGEEGFEIWRMK